MMMPIDTRPLKRLLALLRMDRREITYIYLFAIVSGAISLSLPLGIQAIVNLISGGQLASSWGVLIAFVVIGVGFTGAMQVMQLVLSEHIKQRLFVRATLEFAYRLPRISYKALDGAYLPELVNRFFDTMTIQKGVNKVLLDIPVAGLQILLGLILLAFYHPFFILFGMFVAIILLLVFRSTSRIGLATSLEESKQKYAAAHWLQELGRSNSTFKLAGETTLPVSKADTLATKYVTARKTHFKVLLGHYWALVGFKVLVSLSMLLLGGLLVMNEQMNIGQFVAAEIVIMLVINAVEKILLGFESVYDVLTALEKMGDITDLPLERGDGMNIAVTTDKALGMAIELRDLSFRSHWNDAPVFHNVDLVIAAGEKICVTGAPGAGKTTLLHLLAGLLEPNEGSVLMDGQGLKSLSLENVRSSTGDSFTHEDIFTGTVMENIIMGRPWITDEQARSTATVTGLMPMLADLPKGLLSKLDPHGSRLPQSLIRRIILTRCMASRPRLVLFEEEVMPLEGEELEQYLGLLTGPNAPFTMVAVSDRPEFQRRCDRLIRIEDGTIRIVSNSFN
jgi:ABC-type bacteriocin/lantibiotic exporter with double-glycine peptidase domain